MIDMATDHIAVRFVNVEPDTKELIRQMVDRSLDAD